MDEAIAPFSGNYGISQRKDESVEGFLCVATHNFELLFGILVTEIHAHELELSGLH